MPVKEDKWLYCFNCHSSHIHTPGKKEGKWKCSNCGFERTYLYESYEQILEELEGESDV